MLKALPDQLLLEWESYSERHNRRLQKVGLFVATDPRLEGIPNVGKVVASEEADYPVGKIVYFRKDNPVGFHCEGMRVIPVDIEDVVGVAE